MIGRSPALLALRQRLERVARSPRPALVCGPTGAGKELAVRALHGWSDRGGPLVGVNCGAIPDHLMEDELFGHEKGAFTGADRRRDGYLAEAAGGTLFLDEVAELPLRLQAKLLRVLETGRYRPLGGGAERAFGARIVAATHADLPRCVAAGTFREDLFYRLHVLTVRVPSLAERREDILPLAQHFLREHDRPLRLTAGAAATLAAFAWPGNVRQLRSVVERLALFCDSDLLDEATVRAELACEPTGREPAADDRPALLDLAARIVALPGANKLAAVERAMLDEALRASAGNKSEAARRLGVHRKVVERRLERLARGADPESEGAGDAD